MLKFSVQDNFLHEDSCYQAWPATGDSDLKYQEASDFCSSQLDGSLAGEDILDWVTLFLAGMRPHLVAGSEYQWWIQSDTAQTCRTLSSDGARVTVSEQECDGDPPDNIVRQPLCQLGLQCRSGSVSGGERCVCGCEDHLAIPTQAECEVCLQGQACYHDLHIQAANQSHYCVDQCQDLPAYNVKPCFCHHHVCHELDYENFCIADTGCQKFGWCPHGPGASELYNHTRGVTPQKSEDYNLDFCICGLLNDTQLCDSSQYCHTSVSSDNSTSHDCRPRPPDCPPGTSVAPVGGCTCSNVSLCQEGLMCAGQTGDCVPRPPPCLPLPSVAGGERCVCELPGGTLQVCEEGEACAASCFPPAYCQDPTITATWASHNAVVTSKVKPTMVQGSELEMECLEHTFTSLSLGAGKFEQKFTAVCSDSGQWSEERCTHSLCPQLRVDSASVEVTELFITLNAKSQGSVIKLSCQQEADEFEFGSGTTRLLAVCNRR